jgi:hypothetical protein
LKQNSASTDRHLPSPQFCRHGPQSAGQEKQASCGLHTPLPHAPSQGPQSFAQVMQFSPKPATQMPSPQVPQGPQSPGHEKQVSPPLHWLSPHLGGHAPQSA